MTLTTEVLIKYLRTVTYPGRPQSLMDLNCIQGLRVTPTEAGVDVSFVLEVDPSDGARLEPFRQGLLEDIEKMAGVHDVKIVMTAHKSMPSKERRPGGERVELPTVKYVLAVASGKGGVGKSTTAVNLAIAMAQNKRKVGLVDADIYGPSIPRMLAFKGQPETTHDNKMLPIERYGIKAISMGFIVEEEAPMIWRGPMVHQAIQQLFRDVVWGDLDIIIADLPPGTGDAQLTMAQQIPLSGAVIVSTPQDIALIDARKGLNMFRRVNVPVMGIIENMSQFVCPHCGTSTPIFGHGGAAKEADRLGIPFLGEIALDARVRELSDEGRPIVMSDPECEIAKQYRSIGLDLWKMLN